MTLVANAQQLDDKQAHVSGSASPPQAPPSTLSRSPHPSSISGFPFNAQTNTVDTNSNTHQLSLLIPPEHTPMIQRAITTESAVPIGHERHPNSAINRREVNRVALAHTRQWGHPKTVENDARHDAKNLVISTPHQTQMSRPSSRKEVDEQQSLQLPSPLDAAWDKAAQLQEWAKGVPTTSAPVRQQQDVASASDTGHPPERPDSTMPQLKAATIYYSEDEKTDESLPLSTPKHLSLLSSTRERARPPTVLSVSVAGDDSRLQVASDNDGHPINTAQNPDAAVMVAGNEPRSQFDGDRHPRSGRPGPGDRGQWWKRPPHPIYSPLFAKRRLLIE